ncbi:MAG: DNA replication and repair protein RecF [Gammaproteobacteria bacterium]|nr:DNA replication and repair protein RecF [Gammaproteobacteria bacterium]
MIVDRLEIRNVRNVALAKLQLDSGITFVTGPNGAGKTTLLECLHLLARGRSFRSGALNALITFGEQELLVSAEGSHLDTPLRIGLQKSRAAKVRMRLNQADVRQVSQIAAIVPLQIMLPDTADLVFGPPARRRLWLDWLIFHTDNSYLQELRSFQRALRQRNAALRRRSADIRSWTAQLAQHAEEVSRMRQATLAELHETFDKVLTEMVPNMRISLDYDRGWQEENLSDGLARDSRVELKYGVTRLGPHRSDVRVRALDFDSGNDAGPAARVLSRGQGKAVACAMKLAQVRYLNARSIQSVVLLDDVASEFDDEYGRKFFGALHRTEAQSIATTTQESDIIRLWSSVAGTTPTLVKIRNGTIAQS